MKQDKHITVIRKRAAPKDPNLHERRAEICKALEDITKIVAVQHERLTNILFDEKRGAWGTEAELSLSAAEEDLRQAMEQMAHVRKLSGLRS